MKTKASEESKILNFERPIMKAKKSFRPMRSLVATRSMKPKTTVANMVMLKSEEAEKRD